MAKGARSDLDASWQSAFGKIILTGEHAVVYGAKALAGAFPNAVRARARQCEQGVRVDIPAWQVVFELDAPQPDESTFAASLRLLINKLDLHGAAFHLEVDARTPPGMGLGASASLAVATIRALDYYYQLALSDTEINALAFECEKLAHGTPSGIDNYVACHGGLVCFQRTVAGVVIESLRPIKPIPLVVAMSGVQGVTAEAVARVALARQEDDAKYDALFASINTLSESAMAALVSENYDELGVVLDKNHALLADLGVSCTELEQLRALAKKAGALGAKLTGSGDGGAIIALCPNNRSHVAQSLVDKGYKVMEIDLGV